MVFLFGHEYELILYCIQWRLDLIFEKYFDLNSVINNEVPYENVSQIFYRISRVVVRLSSLTLYKDTKE